MASSPSTRRRRYCAGRSSEQMNLFGTPRAEVSARDAAVAQALADVATIGILQERLIHEGHVVAEQLHSAVEGRIIIKQGKGMIPHVMLAGTERPQSAKNQRLG